MSRVVLEVADLADLELLAEAAETVASQRRVAAEMFAAELSRAKAAGEDVRTRSVQAIQVLGEAGRLVAAAAALRSARPAIHVTVTRGVDPGGLDPAEPAPSAPTSAQESPAAPAAGTGTPKRSRARRSAPSPSVSSEAEPTDPQAAEMLANLRAAGDAALGPDAGHAPDPAESSEVPEPSTELPADFDALAQL